MRVVTQQLGKKDGLRKKERKPERNFTQLLQPSSTGRGGKKIY